MYIFKKTVIVFLSSLLLLVIIYPKSIHAQTLLQKNFILKNNGLYTDIIQKNTIHRKPKYNSVKSSFHKIMNTDTKNSKKDSNLLYFSNYENQRIKPPEWFTNKNKRINSFLKNDIVNGKTNSNHFLHKFSKINPNLAKELFLRFRFQRESESIFQFNSPFNVPIFSYE